jgi:hypothetical protein
LPAAVQALGVTRGAGAKTELAILDECFIP